MLKVGVHRSRFRRPSVTVAAACWTVLGLGIGSERCLAAAPQTELREQPPPPEPWWLVRPWHTEPKILEWGQKYPELVSWETRKTFGGRTAYAVTITNRHVADAPKAKVLFSQPHAHEPGATAGMMDAMAQLLEGRHLDGRASDWPRQDWLDRCLLSFIPDGNPDGRAKAPEDWWDGAKHTNDEFLQFVFGRMPSGERATRVGRWSLREHPPALVGYVYEQINEHEFVEPNRDRDSTFFQLVSRLLDRHQYGLHVDLHQTEFEKSPYNAMVILPCVQNELPDPIRQRNVAAAAAILAAWRTAGGRPIPEAKPLGYGEDQLRYFRQCWGDIYRSLPEVTVEIQNNNPRTTPREQLRLMEIAIRAAIEQALQWSQP